MRASLWNLVGLGILLFSSCLGASSNGNVLMQRVTNSSGPIPPSQDPFYTAPPAFEKAASGTVLRARHAPGNLTSVVKNCSEAYQILYRTTDARFNPSWAVTTLYVPKTGSGTELLSFQVPYNTPSLDHSPSYDFYFQPAVEVAASLGRGWYVNVPDHEGPLAADGANIAQGHATLDSVRAVLSPGLDIGLRPDARYAMWGYSGGALASEWAAELQVQYAPELKFAGTALGGTPQNITSVWDSANESPFSGMIALASTGVVKPYPKAQEFLLSQLKTEGTQNRTEFLKVKDMGSEEAFTFFAGQNMWNYFHKERGILDEPVFRDVLDDNFYMGYHGVPKMPLFMYHAVHDQVALMKNAEALLERFCGVHVDIEFQRNTVGDHVGEMTNGRERALAWLEGVFGGNPAKKGCSIADVTIEASS